MKLLLKFVSGPLAFFLFYHISPAALSPEARIVLAIFGWMVTWWMAQPVPWAISSLLPLLLFPASGLMSIGQTASLYGQNIFFWVMGTILMGYALERHGLAKRFALWFLSLRLVSGSTHHLIFGFMLVTGLISSHISDAATVAMMMPVGLSLASFVRAVPGFPTSQKSNIGALLPLGAMYGAAAGGLTTIMGVPYNALCIDLLERFTGRTLGWFNWMLAGVPTFLTALVTFYIILLLFLPPEISAIPGGEAFLRGQREKLGRFSSGERATLFIFLTMVVLFILPPVVRLSLGSFHPFSQWLSMALSIWTVPVVVLLLLFCTPVDWRKGEFVLNWRDAVEHAPWNIMFLCAAAVAVTGTLDEFGFVDFVGTWIGSLGIGPLRLPFVAAYLMAFGTNLFSGTAAASLFCTIFIPAAQQAGFNPASIAMIIPAMGVGLMLPWSGAVAATAFATGQIEMRNMIRIGAVATVVFAFLVTGIHILLAPIL